MDLLIAELSRFLADGPRWTYELVDGHWVATRRRPSAPGLGARARRRPGLLRLRCLTARLALRAPDDPPEAYSGRMANRLASAISPYLRSHADNPVDWFPWGADAFAEAERRDVPVLISIGYATCHWCHVMARESFSDPELAAYLNERFVAIKVDREEHPEVDASYLSAASAFTGNLGWPLTVFATTRGRAFFAGTYFPPVPVGDRASFHQVLEAVSDAWIDAPCGGRGQRREGRRGDPCRVGRGDRDLRPAVGGGSGRRRRPAGRFRGCGVRRFRCRAEVPDRARRSASCSPAIAAPTWASRTLERMAASPLRDPVEGGFFRYATRRDWGDPHYERMLYDNALLLDAYTRAWQRTRRRLGVRTPPTGIAGFLLTVMRREGGGFASAQDSESVIDGVRVEGRVLRGDRPQERRMLEPPPVDGKVLTGWNGLAIAALARAGFAFDRRGLDGRRTRGGRFPARPSPARRTARWCGRRSTTGPRMRSRPSKTTAAWPAACSRSPPRRVRPTYAVAARDLVDLAIAAGPVGRRAVRRPRRLRSGARGQRDGHPRRSVGGRVSVGPDLDLRPPRTRCTC